MIRIAAIFFLAVATVVHGEKYISHYKTKGVGAYAYANLIPDDDCSYTSFSISASGSAMKDKTNRGKPSTSYSKYIDASFNTYNYCTNEEIGGYVSIDPATFTYDSKKGLQASATIQSFYTCYEVEGQCYYTCEDVTSEDKITITASWVPTGGAPTKSRDNYSYRSSNFSYKAHYSGTSIPVAITFSVSKNGKNLAVDSTSIFGELYTSNSGGISIDRYEY